MRAAGCGLLVAEGRKRDARDQPAWPVPNRSEFAGCEMLFAPARDARRFVFLEPPSGRPARRGHSPQPRGRAVCQPVRRPGNHGSFCSSPRPI